MEMFENSGNYYGHLSGERKEHLKNHMDLMMEYSKRLVREKKLEKIIENLGESFFEKGSFEYKLWEEMFWDTMYYHDIGKVNKGFQKYKMNNENFSKVKVSYTNHSPISSKVYFEKYYDRIPEEKEELFIFLCLNSFVIGKHHGYLGNFKEYLEEDFIKDYDFLERNKEIYSEIISEKFYYETEDIEDFIGNFIEYINTIENVSPWKTLDLYIYTKFLFSLLVCGDFYSTSDFMRNKAIEDFGILKNSNKYIQSFKKSKTYKGIEKYKRFKMGLEENPFLETPINELRSEMFLEAEETLLKNLDKNIFYLEAPTGSGKTITSINLALKFLEKDKELSKIFYVFPFNTLVEQTGKSLKNIFGEKIYKEDIDIINSLSPMDNEENTEENRNSLKIDYGKLLLDRQFLHSPIILTTHVKFFDFLFGTDRESHFPLIQIANSIVIIDEIQAYKNNIWKEIAIFIERYSKLLNIKFIIMSATLPKIDLLINNKDTNEIFHSLIENRDKYFMNELFKNRVQCDYSLLEEYKDLSYGEKLENLKEEIIKNTGKNKKILIEFISKKTSLKFFKMFEDTEYNVELLTGDDNKVERERIIDKISKEEREIILIATQVIEAGVDIDMDIGFKNISILDGEEQFLGRINRSCKKSGFVYFFNIDDGSKIYRSDVRSSIGNTLINEEVREILSGKNFSKYYEKIMTTLERNSNKNNNKNLDDFRKKYLLNFPEVKERLRLIEEKDEYNVFINREIEVNGKKIIGREIWETYKNILEDRGLSYAEKKVKLSQISEKMDYFVYRVKKFNKIYSDYSGFLFYIDNGEDYFIEFNGQKKFDRSKFEGQESEYECFL